MAFDWIDRSVNLLSTYLPHDPLAVELFDLRLYPPLAGALVPGRVDNRIGAPLTRGAPVWAFNHWVETAMSWKILWHAFWLLAVPFWSAFGIIIWLLGGGA